MNELARRTGRDRRRRQDHATAFFMLATMLLLVAVGLIGASAVRSMVQGPESTLESARVAVRNLLAGTTEQTAEDRRTRLEEAMKKAAQRMGGSPSGGQVTPTPPAAASGSLPTQTPVPGDAHAATPSPTGQPDDKDRLRFILGQAVTEYSQLPPDWATNIEIAASRLNDQKIAPGQVFSLSEALGPVSPAQGFRLDLADSLLWGLDRPGCVAGGVCQVSTTLVQAAFAAGLEIVEHHHFTGWIAGFGEGTQRAPGLDARVGPGADLKIRNNTGDWVRIEAWADGRSTGIVLYGIDPGWTVQRTEPKVAARVPAPKTTVRRDVPMLLAGEDYSVAEPAEGFVVQVGRTVIRRGQVIDRYNRTVRYEPMPGVRLVGVLGATPTPTPTPSPTPTATPAAPTPTPTPRRTSSAIFNPDDYRLPNGNIRVPALVGLAEAEARRRIEAVGLKNTHSNYQGPGDVPDQALRTVPVGHVLSQTPLPDAELAPGSTVYIAVRKE